MDIQKTENEKLGNYLNHLILLDTVFRDEELTNLYLTGLISSDTIIDVKSCDESLNSLNVIKSNIEMFDLTDEKKEKIMSFVNKGIKIVKRDRTKFLKEKENKE